MQAKCPLLHTFLTAPPLGLLIYKAFIVRKNNGRNNAKKYCKNYYCIAYWLSSLYVETGREKYKLSKHLMYNIVVERVLDKVQSLSAFSTLSQGIINLKGSGQ